MHSYNTADMVLDNILALSKQSCFALGLCLYYKRSFKCNSEVGIFCGIFALLYLLGRSAVLGADMIIAQLSYCTVIAVVQLLFWTRIGGLSRDEWAKLGTVMFTFTEIYPQIVLYLVQTIAFTQLLRKPTSVKAKLGSMRIICGPLFVLSIYQLALLEHSVLASVRFVLALLAGTVLRPDNRESLLVLPGRLRAVLEDTGLRTRLHGVCVAGAGVLSCGWGASAVMLAVTYLSMASAPTLLARRLMQESNVIAQKIQALRSEPASEQ